MSDPQVERLRTKVERLAQDLDWARDDIKKLERLVAELHDKVRSQSGQAP